MAALPIQDIDLDGINSHTFQAADAGGDEFDNSSGKVLLHVQHVGGSSAPIVITVDSQRECDQGFDHDVTIDIDFGEDVLAGPFDKLRFNDTGGNVQISYDDETDLEIAALRLINA